MPVPDVEAFVAPPPPAPSMQHMYQWMTTVLVYVPCPPVWVGATEEEGHRHILEWEAWALARERAKAK